MYIVYIVYIFKFKLKSFSFIKYTYLNRYFYPYYLYEMVTQ